MKRMVLFTCFVLATACGGGGETSTGNVKTPTAPGGSKDVSKWPADDKTMCDWRNKPELEVSETAGPGALKPLRPPAATRAP